MRTVRFQANGIRHKVTTVIPASDGPLSLSRYYTTGQTKCFLFFAFGIVGKQQPVTKTDCELCFGS